MLLQEIPGAIERPAGCHIQVTQELNAAEITIPARRPAWYDIVIPSALSGLLIVCTYIGAVLFIQHKLIILTDLNVDHGHISRYLLHYLYWLLPFWIGMLAIGGSVLLTLLRVFLLTETLHFDRLGITLARRTPFSTKQVIFLRENLRGFRLRRDPQGMWGSKLALKSVGDEVEVAEFAGEAEREWLASVGNALIGRY